VQEVGIACPDGSRIQPSSPNNLVAAGVRKDEASNEAPDWGLIIGMSYFL